MKSDHPSHRDRLLARVRPEFRAEADRFLRSYSNNPNEPIFWFFALLIEEQTLTRDQVEKQKLRILSLTGPDNWKRIVYAWAIVPTVMTTIIVCAIVYLNSQNTYFLRKFSENPAAVAGYSENTLKALEVANENAAALKAVTNLLNIPNARTGLLEGRMVVLVPRNSVTVENVNDKEIKITFDASLQRAVEYLKRNYKETNENMPKMP